MSDLNPDVRRLVDLARKARTPGAQEQSRIAARLAVPLAASAAAGTAVGAAKAAAGAELAVASAKAASTALFGGLGSLAAKLAAVVALGAVAAAVVAGQREPAQTAVDAPSDPVTQTQPAPEPTAATTAANAVADASAQPGAEPEANGPTAPQKPSMAPAAVHSAHPSHELAQEASLLHEAQSAWRAGQSAEALKLANQHAKRYPGSQLANERDVLRVLSLCKLGQVKGAKQVGTRLLRQTKGSPWYQSVAQSCAAD